MAGKVKIVRHNMPFGNVSSGEAGTYFIGYARSLHPLEAMLEAMVVGGPPENYDHLLDYTHPVTGTNFFAHDSSFSRHSAQTNRPKPCRRPSLWPKRGHTRRLSESTSRCRAAPRR